MTRQRDMFDDPATRHRTDDMDTSVEAAERIVPVMTVIRRRVMAFAHERGERGFTDRELAEEMARRFSAEAMRTSTYRTRRQELTSAGLIYDTGERRTHPPGHRHHAVWAMVPIAERPTA